MISKIASRFATYLARTENTHDKQDGLQVPHSVEHTRNAYVKQDCFALC